MKKAWFAPLILTIAFCSVVIGVYIGRNCASSYISVPNAENSSDTLHYSEDNELQTDRNTSNVSISSGKININTAPKAQLILLPGIGDILAQRIIDYREQYGPFSSPEDITLVEGIGDVRLAEMLEYITVGG